MVVKKERVFEIFDKLIDENATQGNESCETLNKYSKHTDHLTIIYAIHDTESDDSRASFVHITEYYPYISAELQREIDAFIRKASEVKFGESHRL